MGEYIGKVEKEGLEEEYEEVGTRRDLAKESYAEINAIINDLTPIKDLYNDMIVLIPRFGDEYDSLGRNTKVNVEAFQEEIEEISTKLEEFNSGAEDTTKYYIESEEIDREDEKTLENKKVAEEKLEERLKVKNKANTGNKDTSNNTLPDDKESKSLLNQKKPNRFNELM